VREERAVREALVAWAGDCQVRGTVDLGEGRLSDQVNGDLDVVTFHDATLSAIDDGHEVHVDRLEVERGELHLIAVDGRRGDPARRLRTVQERLIVELGPFVVTGNLHRPPSAAPFAALTRWHRFVPMTDAVLEIRGGTGTEARRVLLVNRERISKTEPVAAVTVGSDEPGAGSQPTG
jgi:hypothetical protein